MCVCVKSVFASASGLRFKDEFVGKMYNKPFMLKIKNLTRYCSSACALTHECVRGRVHDLLFESCRYDELAVEDIMRMLM